MSGKITMRNSVSGQLITFAGIGAVGFLIDASILTVLSISLGVNLYGARVVSFMCASFATWALNRKYNFSINDAKDQYRRPQYIRYVAVQTCGALINFGVFSFVLQIIPKLQSFPVAPLAIGSCAAFAFNFLGARFWVYR